MTTLAQAMDTSKEDTYMDTSDNTLIQFWKDYNICDYLRNPAWAWVTPPTSVWMASERPPSRGLSIDLKGFSKVEEVAKMNKFVFQVADNFHLVVVEDDTEDLLTMAPEELNGAVLLELE